MASPPSPPILLQPLAARDSLALQAIYDASASDFSLLAGQPAPAQQASHDLTAADEDEARHILGIFLNDALAGVIDLRFGEPGPQDTRLGLILLAPEHRRRGLGRWALRILEAWLARDTPVERVVVAVQANNYAAQRFFLANGYAFTGESTRLLLASGRLRLLEMHKNLVG